jgi:hypothetical protein
LVFGFMSRWLLCFISWSFVFLHFAIAVLLCLQYSVFWVSCGRLFLILRLLCDQPAIQCLGPAAVSVCLPSPPRPPPHSALCKISISILNCSFLSLICMPCFFSSSSSLFDALSRKLLWFNLSSLVKGGHIYIHSSSFANLLFAMHHWAKVADWFPG